MLVRCPIWLKTHADPQHLHNGKFLMFEGRRMPIPISFHTAVKWLAIKALENAVSENGSTWKFSCGRAAQVPNSSCRQV